MTTRSAATDLRQALAVAESVGGLVRVGKSVSALGEVTAVLAALERAGEQRFDLSPSEAGTNVAITADIAITGRIATFAALFPIINPIGIVAEFLGLTSAMAPSERRRQAMKAATTAALLLTVFVLVGNYLLTLFDLSLAAIETAGGLLVGYVGWKMATQPPDHPRPKPGAEGSVYLFPIAFPLLAGPGALAVSLSIVTRHDSWLDFPGTILGVVAISGVALIAMWAAGPISRRLGDHGIEILVRLMGVIVLAIAAELVFHGIASHFDLGVSHQI